MNDWSDKETEDPLYADRRNFCKVEKWSGDGLRVELVLYAGNSLEKANGYNIVELRAKRQRGIPYTDLSSADRYNWPSNVSWPNRI